MAHLGQVVADGVVPLCADWSSVRREDVQNLQRLTLTWGQCVWTGTESTYESGKMSTLPEGPGEPTYLPVLEFVAVAEGNRDALQGLLLVSLSRVSTAQLAPALLKYTLPLLLRTHTQTAQLPATTHTNTHTRG